MGRGGGVRAERPHDGAGRPRAVQPRGPLRGRGPRRRLHHPARARHPRGGRHAPRGVAAPGSTSRPSPAVGDPGQRLDPEPGEERTGRRPPTSPRLRDRRHLGRGRRADRLGEGDRRRAPRSWRHGTRRPPRSPPHRRRSSAPSPRLRRSRSWRAGGAAACRPWDRPSDRIARSTSWPRSSRGSGGWTRNPSQSASAMPTTAPGRQHPPHLRGAIGVGVRHVLQHRAREHGVEGGVGEGQVLAPCRRRS